MKFAVSSKTLDIAFQVNSIYRISLFLLTPQDSTIWQKLYAEPNITIISILSPVWLKKPTLFAG